MPLKPPLHLDVNHPVKYFAKDHPAWKLAVVIVHSLRYPMYAAAAVAMYWLGKHLA